MCEPIRAEPSRSDPIDCSSTISALERAQQQLSLGCARCAVAAPDWPGAARCASFRPSCSREPTALMAIAIGPPLSRRSYPGRSCKLSAAATDERPEFQALSVRLGSAFAARQRRKRPTGSRRRWAAACARAAPQPAAPSADEASQFARSTRRQRVWLADCAGRKWSRLGVSSCVIGLSTLLATRLNAFHTQAHTQRHT